MNSQESNSKDWPSIPFAEWMAVGFPISVILLLVCWLHLTRNAFRLSNETVPGSQEIIQAELDALGPMKKEEKWVMYVFATVAFNAQSLRIAVTTIAAVL